MRYTGNINPNNIFEQTIYKECVSGKKEPSKKEPSKKEPSKKEPIIDKINISFNSKPVKCSKPCYQTIFHAILSNYNMKDVQSLETYLNDFTLNMATELDEKSLYTNFKYNSRSGMSSTHLQSELQNIKSYNNLSCIFYLGDYINHNIYIVNDNIYIAVTKIKDRPSLYIKYSNKQYQLSNITPTTHDDTFKEFSYIDTITPKNKKQYIDKLLSDYGIVVDLKNVTTIYIPNPLLKSITSYKLPELIAKATELNINITNIKQTKASIYKYIFNKLN